MDIFNLFTLFGGLALFLYGMDLMGKGLEQLAGGKLEKILESLTSNVFKGVLLGAGVTAVIQSSSAVTVMVVGFVNSGIMKLGNAVGIIMGANIGTTATSWLLSLTGLSSDNFWLRLCKPSSFSPILAVIGIIFVMFSKKEKKHNIGFILLGFAILMTGMETMSGAVEPLKDMPSFTNILLMFSNPILGVIAGAVLTAIIQSSSASVGILQALCMTGKVPFATAIPIIMGQNIGTCVTAIISSVGASRNAKRAASIHFMFNLIGTIIFMVVFYSINSFFYKFAFLNDSATVVGIAIVHSSFNIGATVVLLPFAKLFVKLSYLVLPETDEEKESAKDSTLLVLDERFLDTPSFALAKVQDSILTMMEKSKSAVALSTGLIRTQDQKVNSKVKRIEESCDQYESVISNYLLELASRNLTMEESKKLNLYLNSVADVESITDYTVDLSLICDKLQENQFSPEALDELDVLNEALLEMISSCIDLVENGSGEECYVYYQVIQETIDVIKQRHVERLTNKQCSVNNGVILMDILSTFEGVSLAITKIANSIYSMNHVNLKGDNTTVSALYDSYSRKFMLPEE